MSSLLHTLTILFGNHSNGVTLDPPSETLFRFPIVIILIAIGVALGSGIASIVALRRNQPRQRVVNLLAIAVIVGPLFTPILIVSKIAVTTDHVEETIAFWPIGSRKYLEYRDIAFIHPATNVVKGSPRRIWYVQDIHGQSTHIVLSNLWELHEAAIKTRLQQYGVVFRE
jgi:hypothetical protein